MDDSYEAHLAKAQEAKAYLCEMFGLDPDDVDTISIQFTKDWGGNEGRHADAVIHQKGYSSYLGQIKPRA